MTRTRLETSVLFFDAKLLEMESATSPASIITSAYPESKVDKAEISQRSTDEIRTAIKNFFSTFTDADGRTSVMANEFLNSVRSCVNLDNSKGWEYFPDWRSSDELYDYIAIGFTYIFVDRDEPRCLVVHGGYMGLIVLSHDGINHWTGARGARFAT